MVTINHGSMYAHDPRAAAEHLAAITGGHASAFHACDGAWVCFLSGEGAWDGPLIELYPRTMTMAHEEGRVLFRKLRSPARGAGAHFNLGIEKSRKQLEKICRDRGLVHAWRDWAGLLDVWLDDELLIECVPA